MQVAITARHIDLTVAMRRHVEERLKKVERLLDPPLSASVVLSVEKYRHSAELTVQGNGYTFHGSDVTDDLYAAVDKAADKVRRQVEKRKHRPISIRSRRRKRLNEAAESPPGVEEAGEEGPASSAREEKPRGGSEPVGFPSDP